eukprot:CAMPEP_0169190780 /NCGR_PEP_ID=MMETSP1016-20121227/4722_1 /TAXON_ID=342587 /ORGANISM="Karlodinium micrum, Strain CCMP2283" /LENGTH=175 /DNA_ID=CAMNT_0009266993 /DNA_START=39 /DNA_END=566 /DNA_ORIENTATION=-
MAPRLLENLAIYVCAEQSITDCNLGEEPSGEARLTSRFVPQVLARRVGQTDADAEPAFSWEEMMWREEPEVPFSVPLEACVQVKQDSGEFATVIHHMRYDASNKQPKCGVESGPICLPPRVCTWHLRNSRQYKFDKLVQNERHFNFNDPPIKLAHDKSTGTVIQKFRRMSPDEGT